MKERNLVKTILNKREKTLQDAHQLFCYGADKIGFNQMILLLASFFEKLSSPKKQTVGYRRQVLDFLLVQVMETYELKQSMLFNINILEYRHAKWIYAHLAYKYLNLSYEKLAENLGHLQAKKGSLERAVNKCQSILDTEFELIPNFKDNYQVIETHLIQFIGQLD